MSTPQALPFAAAFERALDTIRAHVPAASAGSPSIAIAYSGGLDSSVLLHLAHAYASAHGLTLIAFHIHHGLSLNADAWLLHCAEECLRLGVRSDMRRVTIQQAARDGIEQAARLSRYAALGDLCRAHHVPLLLTAHHQDDQAETVMLQLLRGSGIAGLSGMEQVGPAPDLVGDPGLVIGRPLLQVSRADLEQFATAHQVRYVNDESNVDVRFARNALRQKVMPALAECFPGFQRRVSRAAQHAQSAQRVLNEVAAQDLTECVQQDGGIEIRRLIRFSPDRINNLLRYWLGAQGLRMPSTAWLDEMREQLLTAREDAQVCVIHADGVIRRYRGHIHLTPRLDGRIEDMPPLTFRWNGEARMDFASFGGALHFDQTQAGEEGVDTAWLRTQDLQLGLRSGGEKLKLALNRPTRSLKYHYQALGIPAWERARLPVVKAGGQLVFAAGIGMNWGGFSPFGEASVRLRWEKTPR